MCTYLPSFLFWSHYDYLKFEWESCSLAGTGNCSKFLYGLSTTQEDLSWCKITHTFVFVLVGLLFLKKINKKIASNITLGSSDINLYAWLSVQKELGAELQFGGRGQCVPLSQLGGMVYNITVMNEQTAPFITVKVSHKLPVLHM